MNAAFFEKQSTKLRAEPVRYRYILATFLVYAPLIVIGFLWSVRAEAVPMASSTVIARVVLGLFAWTLLEYLLHRFVHIGRITAGLHMTHHRRPMYAAKVTTPVWGSLPIALAVLGLFRLSSATWETSLLLTTGIVVGYLLYEVVHFRIHYGLNPGPLIGFQRAAHTIHHQDRARCFGVTTPVWDWVFRTGMH